MEIDCQYDVVGGEEVKANPSMMCEMSEVFASRMDDKAKVLQYISDDAMICTMRHEGRLVGFSWVEFGDSATEAELAWFATRQGEMCALEGKGLLDYTLEKCKGMGAKVVRFNCFDQSWGRIQNRNRLMKRFGYKVLDDTQDESGFDMSIEL